MHTSQNKYYKCSLCDKMILKANKATHDKKCKSKKNNRKMSTKNISKYQNSHLIFYICELCGEKMTLKDKPDHLLCHELENMNKQDFKGLYLNQKKKKQYVKEINFNFCDDNLSFAKTKIIGIKYINPYYRNNRDDNSSSDSNSHRRRNQRNRRRSMAMQRRTFLDPSFSDSSSDNSFSSSSSVSIDNNSNNNISSKINEGLDDETINKYPESTIKSVKKLAEDKKKCLICLEKFVKGQKSIALPCIHIFHSQCIKQWMRKKNSCPICKNKIFKKK